MHLTRPLRIASFICALAVGCGGSDGNSDDNASGKDGGGDGADAAAHHDDGSGGGEHHDDAGSSEANDDAGGNSGGTDASMAQNDAGGSNGGSGGSSSMTTDDCVPKEGAVPTWTEVDPKLPDYEVRDIGVAGAAPPAGFGGVAYGNGVFVAIGLSSDEDHMRWATSTDGMKWTGHEQPIDAGKTYSGSVIHFLNGKFVFFQVHTGAGFYVYSSSDGMKWTSSKVSDDNFAVSEFDSDGDQIVVVGDNGKAQRSSDLKTWTPLGFAGGSFNDVAFGAGRWVATINAGGEVFGSADGEEWDMIDGLTTPGGFYVAFGNDVWTLSGGGMYLTGTDGKKFDAVTPAHYGTGVRFAGGRFIDNGDDGTNTVFSVSDDGKTWTEYGKLPSEKVASNEKFRSRLIKDTAYGNCRYVATGFISVQTNPTNPSDILSATQSVLPLVLVGVLESK
jgi:hypothetical protein